MYMLSSPLLTARETLDRLSVLREEIDARQMEASALRAHLLSFADIPPALHPSAMPPPEPDAASITR